MFEFYHVLKVKQPDDLLITQFHRKLLKQRLLLPVGRELIFAAQTNKRPPHESMKPSKISLGMHTFDNSLSAMLGFRMTYFDLLSSSVGRNKFTNLEMVDVELIADENQLKIHKVDLVDIDSLSVISLPNVNEISFAWEIRGGYEQAGIGCIDCGIYLVEGGFGKSWQYGTDSLFYALAGGKGYIGDQRDVDIYTKFGFIGAFNDVINYNVEIQPSKSVLNRGYISQRASASLNWQFAHSWELRVNLAREQTQYQNNNLFELKFNYFWGF